MKWLALLMIASIAVGCAGIPTRPVAVCQDAAGPSLLEQYIPDLRMADTLFKLVVLEIGRLDKVKQKDIKKVLDEAEALLDQSTTYSGLVMYLLPKFKWIRENAGAEVIIIGDYFTTFSDVSTPITPKDICYLKYHINEQRKKVLLWIQ